MQYTVNYLTRGREMVSGFEHTIGGRSRFNEYTEKQETKHDGESKKEHLPQNYDGW